MEEENNKKTEEITEKNIPVKSSESNKLAKFFARNYKLVTLVSVILIILLGYYLLTPRYQEVSLGGKYNIDTLEKEKNARQKYLEDLKTLIANYDRVNSSDIEKLNNILPEEKDVPGIFIQLQNLALENNFLLTSVNISSPPSSVSKSQGGGKSQVEKLTININLIGDDYKALKNFLDDVEYNLRLFDVNAVYFTPESDVYSISLFTYYFPQ